MVYAVTSLIITMYLKNTSQVLEQNNGFNLSNINPVDYSLQAPMEEGLSHWEIVVFTILAIIMVVIKGVKRLQQTQQSVKVLLYATLTCHSIHFL